MFTKTISQDIIDSVAKIISEKSTADTLAGPGMPVPKEDPEQKIDNGTGPGAKRHVKDILKKKTGIEEKCDISLKDVEKSKEDKKLDAEHKDGHDEEGSASDKKADKKLQKKLEKKCEKDLEESFNQGTVTIHSPGHSLHGKEAHVFHRHDDGRVNVQVVHSNKKGDVSNFTLKPGQFKETNEHPDVKKFHDAAVTGNPRHFAKEESEVAEAHHLPADVEKEVKKMKPHLKDFKARYGDKKGESVFYGRATNVAKNEEVELEEEQLDEATRKHFKMIADTVKMIEDPKKRQEAADMHAAAFEKMNPRFDHGKFHAACGTEHCSK